MKNVLKKILFVVFVLAVVSVGMAFVVLVFALPGVMFLRGPEARVFQYIAVGVLLGIPVISILISIGRMIRYYLSKSDPDAGVQDWRQTSGYLKQVRSREEQEKAKVPSTWYLDR